MSKKYYTIVKTNYDYNDEVYYASENDAGLPILVYSSREKAEEKAKLKNKEEIINLISDPYGCIGAYGYNWDDIMDTDTIDELNLSKYYVHDFDKNIFDNFTDEQKEKFINGIVLNFYTIVAVEAGD